MTNVALVIKRIGEDPKVGNRGLGYGRGGRLSGPGPGAAQVYAFEASTNGRDVQPKCRCAAPLAMSHHTLPHAPHMRMRMHCCCHASRARTAPSLRACAPALRLQAAAKRVRFFGKLLGLYSDYYVFEVLYKTAPEVPDLPGVCVCVWPRLSCGAGARRGGGGGLRGKHLGQPPPPGIPPCAHPARTTHLPAAVCAAGMCCAAVRSGRREKPAQPTPGHVRCARA